MTPLAFVLLFAIQSPVLSRGFILAGEPIRFDTELRPTFTAKQIEGSTASVRDGFVKWAATPEGKAIIAKFRGGDREVVITESADEPSIGSAPQPGFLTMLAANDRAKLKTYQLIVNPDLASQYNGPASTIDLGLPRTAADVMALAWAGEMLHIDFYAEGIPLPHHDRVAFQDRWLNVAASLGFPRVPHVTGDEFSAPAGPDPRRSRDR
jgi:hypothetical protein